VPASEQLSDYQEGIINLITNLSVIEDRHPVEVLNEVLGQNGSDLGARGNGANATEAAAAVPG